MLQQVKNYSALFVLILYILQNGSTSIMMVFQDVNLLKETYIQSLGFFCLEQDMTSILTFADFLTTFPQFGPKPSFALRGYLMHQTLNHIVAELMFG